jgi:ubiquinone/menaquinone biosynthesis C-methylase UbiE
MIMQAKRQYVLEDDSEFSRLERQSELPKYDYRKELADLDLKAGQKVLDAGCGSGVVSRFLAKTFRSAQVVGCDFAESRIALASEAAQGLFNLKFVRADLSKPPFPDEAFDVIVCRYVIEHLSAPVRVAVMKELYRCLKPGGTLWLIDFDGSFQNLYPQPPIAEQVFEAVRRLGAIDLEVGRKLPSLALQAGFESAEYRIETFACGHEQGSEEFGVIAEKLHNTYPFVTQLLGNETEARRFFSEYLAALRVPGAVLLENKFTVQAKKRAE